LRDTPAPVAAWAVGRWHSGCPRRRGMKAEDRRRINFSSGARSGSLASLDELSRGFGHRPFSGEPLSSLGPVPSLFREPCCSGHLSISPGRCATGGVSAGREWGERELHETCRRPRAASWPIQECEQRGRPRPQCRWSSTGPGSPTSTRLTALDAYRARTATRRPSPTWATGSSGAPPRWPRL